MHFISSNSTLTRIKSCIILLQIISRPFDECGIEYIDDDAFYGLSLITQLSFSGCSLTNAPSLQYIRSTLAWWDFARNSIQAIPDDYFKGCQRLRILRCESCKLSSVPNLRPISQTTESLMLDQNDIPSISSLYELPFRALKYIYLAHNSINHIEVNRLILPMLAAINLQWNLIMSLDDVSHSGWGLLNTGVLRGDSSSLDQKVALYLGGNPWYCDNRLIWMSIAVGQDHGENMTFAIADGLNVRCASPPSLHGHSIDSIGK